MDLFYLTRLLPPSTEPQIINTDFPVTFNAGNISTYSNNNDEDIKNTLKYDSVQSLDLFYNPTADCGLKISVFGQDIDLLTFDSITGAPIVGPFNPFNQDLNTFNSPSFNSLTLTGINGLRTNVLQGLDNTNYITFEPDGAFDDAVVIQKPRLILGYYMDTAAANDPGTVGLSGNGGRIYNDINGNIVWRTLSGNTILNFDQSLNTADSPTFVDVTVDSLVANNDEISIEKPIAFSLAAEFCSGSMTLTADTVQSLPLTMSTINAGETPYMPILNTTNRDIQFTEDGVYLVKFNVANSSAFLSTDIVQFDIRSASLAGDRITVPFTGIGITPARYTLGGMLIPGAAVNSPYSLYSTNITNTGPINFNVSWEVSRVK